jgi:CRP-like cAMP-binding protein
MTMTQSAETRYTEPVLVACNKPQSADDDRVFMSQHPLFQSLSAEHLKQLTHHSRRLRLGHHQLLYRQDMPAQHFFFVLSGRLRLYRLDSSGIDRTLDSIAAGGCVAEVMIYAEPARYACFAEALKASEVLMIPVRTYQTLLEASPVYAQAVLRHYAQRAVSRLNDLEIMTIQSARERLVRYLIDLLPNGAEQAGELELPLPKCLVASRLAMQPETLSRILAELKSRGLLLINRNRLVIPHPQKLIDACL